MQMILQASLPAVLTARAVSVTHSLPLAAAFHGWQQENIETVADAKATTGSEWGSKGRRRSTVVQT